MTFFFLRGGGAKIQYSASQWESVSSHCSSMMVSETISIYNLWKRAQTSPQLQADAACNCTYVHTRTHSWITYKRLSPAVCVWLLLRHPSFTAATCTSVCSARPHMAEHMNIWELLSPLLRFWPLSHCSSQGWDKTWFCLAAGCWRCIDTCNPAVSGERWEGNCIREERGNREEDRKNRTPEDKESNSFSGEPEQNRTHEHNSWCCFYRYYSSRVTFSCPDTFIAHKHFNTRLIFPWTWPPVFYASTSELIR